jgi:hypothetical protein
MHKYEKQKVSCGGTDAKDTSDSIHTRHLMCMFDVVVHSRCRKMYAEHALERLQEDEQQHVSPGEDDEERMKRAVTSTLPKNLIARTPYKYISHYYSKPLYRRSS